MKFLIFIFWGISFSVCGQGESVRDTLAGKFSKFKTTISIHQQVAQQGATGYSFEVERAYLKLGGQDYKIYRLSKKEILEIDPPTQNPQFHQRHSQALTEDYFLKGNFKADNKFVLIEGFIDKEMKIIYEAKFISALSDEEIIQVLNTCLIH